MFNNTQSSAEVFKKTEQVMPELNITNLRIDAAERGKWNIGFFTSGFVFWIYVAIIGNNFPLATVRIYWVAGTFLIFPIAVIMSKIFKADPFTKGNTLGDLVGYTDMSIISLVFPIIIVTANYIPEALLFVMAICYCLDFFVMSWAFGTPLYGVHAALRTLTVTIIYFAMPSLRIIALPLEVAFLYLATVIMIPFLRKKWLQKNMKSSLET
jgi:hypothetical protein